MGKIVSAEVAMRERLQERNTAGTQYSMMRCQQRGYKQFAGNCLWFYSRFERLTF